MELSNKTNTEAHRGRPLQWSYGVTTVPERKEDLLPATLASLAESGFDQPILFVDGLPPGEAQTWEVTYNLPVVPRWPRIRTYGHWLLSLYELYLRSPAMDRYAVFQDDFICVRGLKEYLDACAYPEKGYLNLYTFPQNLELCPQEGGKRKVGFYPSNQRGRGAVALVFSRSCVVTLLGSKGMSERAQDPDRGWRNVDGGVVTAMQFAGWQEYVHNPSLVQHTGQKSSMGNREHPQADSFPGEQFDARTLIEPGPRVRQVGKRTQ